MDASNLTKYDLAAFVVQELYSLGSPPARTDGRVRSRMRLDKNLLLMQYELAVNARNSRLAAHSKKF